MSNRVWELLWCLVSSSLLVWRGRGIRGSYFGRQGCSKHQKTQQLLKGAFENSVIFFMKRKLHLQLCHFLLNAYICCVNSIMTVWSFSLWLANISTFINATSSYTLQNGQDFLKFIFFPGCVGRKRSVNFTSKKIILLKAFCKTLKMCQTTPFKKMQKFWTISGQFT